MAKANAKPEPIRQSVHVDCPVEDAFRLFTEGFSEWWPHSVAGDEVESCAIEPWVGGRVFERTRSGEERNCGSVIAWNPPTHLEFSWHPGEDDASLQTVNVEFRVEADGTRVTLIHTGWETTGISVCRAQGSAMMHTFAGFVSDQVSIAV